MSDTAGISDEALAKLEKSHRKAKRNPGGVRLSYAEEEFHELARNAFPAIVARLRAAEADRDLVNDYLRDTAPNIKRFRERLDARDELRDENESLRAKRDELRGLLKRANVRVRILADGDDGQMEDEMLAAEIDAALGKETERPEGGGTK